MKYSFRHEDRGYEVTLQKNEQGYRATVAGQTLEVQVLRVEPGELRLLVGGRPLTVHWALDGRLRWVSLNGETYVLEKSPPSPASSPSAGRPGDAPYSEKTLRAPMPGLVQAAQVTEGDPVEKGQTLLLLEAMKMVIRVQAPQSGRVARLCVAAGETVAKDQVLVELE